MKENQLFTVRQFCKQFGWPSEPAMRAYIFRAEENGLKEAFIRLGRRVLIDENKFFSLVRQLDQSEGVCRYEESHAPRPGKPRF